MEGSSRIVAIVGLVVGLTVLTIAANPVSASHWCQPATITYGPSSGYVGDSTQFSYRLDDNINDALTVNDFYVTYSWSSTQWDLGTATIPGLSSHTFYQTAILPATAGAYTITLSVNGYAGGDFASSTCNWSPVQFTVHPYTAPSVIATASATTGAAPLTVTFTASVSNGLAPFSYAWTFGDGATGSGASASHTYSQPGTYAAKVVVTDGRTNSASDTVTVTVTSAVASALGSDSGIFAVVLAVIVIVALVTAVVIRRRRQPPQQPSQPPVQPPMPPP